MLYAVVFCKFVVWKRSLFTLWFAPTSLPSRRLGSYPRFRIFWSISFRINFKTMTCPFLLFLKSIIWRNKYRTAITSRTWICPLKPTIFQTVLSRWTFLPEIPQYKYSDRSRMWIRLRIFLTPKNSILPSCKGFGNHLRFSLKFSDCSLMSKL